MFLDVGEDTYSLTFDPPMPRTTSSTCSATGRASAKQAQPHRPLRVAGEAPPHCDPATRT